LATVTCFVALAFKRSEDGGDIGQAKVHGDVLELIKVGGDDCGLTIHRSATGATIAESACVLDHGTSCSFDTQGKTLNRVK
jgi:hypothetical protein